MHLLRTGVAVTMAAVLTATATGCAADGPALPTPSGASAGPSGDPAGGVRGTFAAWTPGARAVTYDPAAVPVGATAYVLAAPAGGGVTVALSVTGMVPGRAYGAHLHTAACTAVPDQAGPHYQHARDPQTPSVDPGYANPRNEVWLDFTADAAGAALTSNEHLWPFDPTRPPRSLVVHAQQTRRTPGAAGTAGPRVACLTL